ncbi:MAG: hypothetical protein M3O07_07835 [Pseudomonadota bacterium]|nr:hypothetical protein [Pseudomonadota bacterium]
MRAALHPTGLFIASREIAPGELQDPFMQETVVRVAAPERIDQVERALVGGAPGVVPAGLVFHVSRCGSTLVTQMLKQHGNLVVYAEPLPFNELLLPPHAWPRRELVGAIRSLGHAFARHAGRPFVLKFTSWNTIFCDIVAQAFPSSPWILCVRDPVEVGVSLLERPPGWLGLVDAGRQAATPEEKVAQVLGAFCDSAARLDAARGRLVRYESLPGAVWDIVAPHFSLAIDAAGRQRMQEIAGVQSKSPLGTQAEFVADAAAKQAAASASLRRAIDALARPKLAMLEKIHAGASR